MKLYNKSELRHSRIFFDKKPPAYAFFLIFSAGLFFVGLTIAAAYIPKNYIVKAIGNTVIRGTEFLSTSSHGRILTLHKNEGDSVKVGEVILELSTGQEGLQAEALMIQLEKLRSKESIFQKYEQSLNEKVNYLLNSGEEQEYYGKVEYYLSQLQSENYHNGTQYSRLQEEYVKLDILLAEKNKLEVDLQDKQSELEQLEQQLASTSSSSSNLQGQQDSPDNETIDIKNKIEEVKSRIETVQASVQGKMTEIDGQKSSIKDLERSYNDPTSQAYSTYSQLISELGTARANNKKNIIELEANLGVVTGQDRTHIIRSSGDGILHYVIPLKEGMSVQQNQTIAEISEVEKEAYIEAFVSANDISRVSKGALVDVAIIGVNSQKYGTLKGRVNHIDAGTIRQETQDGVVNLYKIMIELQSTQLKKGQETILLTKDMPVEARIVYDKETYLDWLLELLRFK